ncbi:MAG: alkylmercury lyase family protein [Streptomycetales bacterium]
MRIEVLHVPGCPNLDLLLERLQEVLGCLAPTAAIESDEAAVARGMNGSPTLLVAGVDPFAEPGQRPGLACRLYRDEDGQAVAVPSAAQLRAVFEVHRPASDLTRWRRRAVPSEPELRAVHQAVLRAFAATGRPPAAGELDSIAAVFDTSTVSALAALHDADSIRLDPAGRIAVAYPFSAVPTRHRVRIADRVDVHAMCAIDALGIPAMLSEDVVISSTDPTTGEPVVIRVDDGLAVWEPAEAVVYVGAAAGGPSAECCCEYLNFFTAARTARAWAAAHPQLPGGTLTVADAVQLGARIFGHLLAT